MTSWARRPIASKRNSTVELSTEDAAVVPTMTARELLWAPRSTWASTTDRAAMAPTKKMFPSSTRPKKSTLIETAEFEVLENAAANDVNRDARVDDVLAATGEKLELIGLLAQINQ